MVIGTNKCALKDLFHCKTFHSNSAKILYSVYFSLQAFSSLAESAYELACTDDDDSEPDTYALSSTFEALVSKIMAAADR